MPAERFEFRISVSRLLIGVLLTILPISLVGLWSIAQTRSSLRVNIGTHFRTIAQSTAAEVSRFVHDRLTTVSLMARAPLVVETIVTANAGYRGMSENAIGEKIRRIESIWETPAADSVVQPILSSRTSRFLRQCREADKRFLRITVTDARGATVAGTHKTLDYYQADEDFWEQIYAQGRGGVNITDVLYDDATKSYYIGIGVPVMEEGTNRFLGAVDALVDVSTLFPLVQRPQEGFSWHTLLVKDDGTVIAGPEVNLALDLKSEEYAALEDAPQLLGPRQTGYLEASFRGGAQRLIGFADTGLKQDYRNLGWLVLVSQDTREAYAPIRAAGRLIGLMSLVGLAGVILLAVYFALHRTQVVTEIEPLRHEYGSPSGGAASE